MNETSATLLERLRRPSDHDAWVMFVQLYTPLLYKWASQLGLQSAEAADLVQDVFVKLLRTLPEFEYDRQRSFRAWLSTLVRNHFRDAQRKLVPLTPGTGFDLAADDPIVEIAEVEYRTYLTERSLQLVQREFSPPTWKAFWGVVVDGRPVAVVGKEQGLSTNAVYLARGRVLRRLREALRGLLD